jgi:LmbE family N-acetylglucosaminyl deacetylase
VILAPHPDDDVIGCFALIRRLRRAGTRVGVIVVSDGTASHRPAPGWPPARLAAARAAETRRGLALAGLARGDVSFLGLPDGALSALPVEAGRRLDRAIRRQRPGLLVAPAADDAHPDHRWVAAQAARCRVPRRLSYRVWPPAPRPGAATGPGSGAVLALALGRDRALKRAAIRQHLTQTRALAHDPDGFTITPALLAAFAGARERFGRPRRGAR